MPTIIDVAKLAGVSVSTVSLVLNTTPEEKKVAAATRAKVLEAMRTIGYRPSVSARKLRKQGHSRPVIALYWAVDNRTQILGKVISYLTKEFEESYFDCELTVRLYHSGKLSECIELITGTDYNAVMLGCMDRVDIEFLDQLNFSIPAVLFNLHSDRHHAVATAPKKNAQIAAELLYNSGIQTVSCVLHDRVHYEQEPLVQSFQMATQEYGIKIIENYTVSSSTDYSAIETVTRKISEKMPDAILHYHERIAVTSNSMLVRNGIRIPEDIKVLLLNVTSSQYASFSLPSITCIEPPTAEMVRNCAKILIHLFSNPSAGEKVIYKEFPATCYYGDSLPRTV